MTELISALRKCAGGKWGIFGQNEELVAAMPILQSAYKGQADKLMATGKEIQEMRRNLGLKPFYPFERYLDYRTNKSANAPGEPKLAVKLLGELGVEVG